jgi:hypothetical protein
MPIRIAQGGGRIFCRRELPQRLGANRAVVQKCADGDRKPVRQEDAVRGRIVNLGIVIEDTGRIFIADGRPETTGGKLPSGHCSCHRHELRRATVARNVTEPAHYEGRSIRAGLLGIQAFQYHIVRFIDRAFSR